MSGLDRALLGASLAVLAWLGVLAAVSGRTRLGRSRAFGILLAGLLLAYGAVMAWGWARRAADFDRSTRRAGAAAR